jgi:putative hydrolase of the HAD superfamily
MAIETLFLDAGGVLLNPNWRRVSGALAARGVDAPAEVLAAAEPRAKRELDAPERIGATDDAGRGWLYFNLVLRHAGITPSEATDAALLELKAYHARENLWEAVPDEVVPVLEGFRRRGLRLVVVSNANGRLAHVLGRLDLLRLLDHALDSHEVGVEKPDPRLFEIALTRSGARRETTLHVGDLYNVDVVGARAAGLRAVLFDSADLYAGVDCPRVPSLTALLDLLAAGRL